MKLPLLIITLLVAQVSFASDAGVTLGELLTNTNRTGTVLLDQGYQGEFTKAYEDVPLPGEKQRAMEFTHAWFDERGIGKRAPAAPAVAIGISAKDGNERAAKGFRSLATYREAIPDFNDLKRMRTMKDFEAVFGPFRGWTGGWGLPGEMHSSLGWMAFTPQR